MTFHIVKCFVLKDAFSKSHSHLSRILTISSSHTANEGFFNHVKPTIITINVGSRNEKSRRVFFYSCTYRLEPIPLLSVSVSFFNGDLLCDRFSRSRAYQNDLKTCSYSCLENDRSKKKKA